MKYWILFMALAGCTSSRAVRCDAHLEPINAPAPKAAATTAVAP